MGAAAVIVEAPWLFKAHLVLGMTLFVVFPFSRLVHIWSAPFRYLGRRYQAVRTRRPRPAATAAGREAHGRAAFSR